MNKKIIFALYKKEIMDILRDKKTLLMMIVVPLILYPLLFVGSMALASSMANQSVTKVYSIAYDNFPGDSDLPFFISTKSADFDYDFVVISDILVTDTESHTEAPADLDEALREERIDAYISYENVSGRNCYYIHYCSSKNDSATCRGMLDDVLEEYMEYERVKILEEAGLDSNKILESVKVFHSDVATKEETIGSLVGYIIPFLLISSVLMGAMYPAIDTTAGEKERGTLETLLTMPVKSIELIMAKFLATSTIAVAAAFLNVLSMGFLGAYFYQSVSVFSDNATVFNVAVYIPAILITLVIAIIFAMFCSAVCLLVCVFAKSFKEAQNYITPILLVFMMSGMAGMIPGISLNKSTMFIPVVNIALLIMMLFSFEFNAYLIINIIVINIAYCTIAVIIMARAFSSERILFSDGIEGIHILESRRNMRDKQIPGYGDLVLIFAMLLLIIIFAGSFIVVKLGMAGLILQQILMALLVIGYAIYIKVDVKEIFSLNVPKIKDLLGAVLIWAGVLIFMMFLSALLYYIFPGNMEGSEASMDMLTNGVPFALVVLAVAFIPAICEELCFRGILFGTLNKRLKPIMAIVITGLIFGIYHMDIVKIFVVGILGIALAYVVYKTKSIFCSMLMHFLNNLYAITLELHQEEIFKMLHIDANLKLNGVIISLIIVVALLFIGIGLYLINYKNKLKQNDI